MAREEPLAAHITRNLVDKVHEQRTNSRKARGVDDDIHFSARVTNVVLDHDATLQRVEDRMGTHVFQINKFTVIPVSRFSFVIVKRHYTRLTGDIGPCSQSRKVRNLDRCGDGSAA